MQPPCVAFLPVYKQSVENQPDRYRYAYHVGLAGAAFSLVNIYIVLGLIIVTIAVWGVKSIWWGIEYKIEERRKSRKASGN